MTLTEDFGVFNFITDIDRGANLLPEFLKNSENVVALINAIMPEIQELHDAQSDVYSQLNIFDATGTNLDNIFGNILNTPRETGQSDDDYRADLLVAVVRFARSGDIVTMKSLYMNLASASSVSLTEYQPAHFKMDATVVTIPTTSELTKIRETLTIAKQGGNQMTLSMGVAPILKLVASNPQTNSPTGLSGGGHTGGTLATGF